MKNVNLIFSSSQKKGIVYYQITRNTEKQRLILSFCKWFSGIYFLKKTIFTTLKIMIR